jgi:hypothetical protein
MLTQSPRHQPDAPSKSESSRIQCQLKDMEDELRSSIKQRIIEVIEYAISDGLDDIHELIYEEFEDQIIERVDELSARTAVGGCQ